MTSHTVFTDNDPLTICLLLNPWVVVLPQQLFLALSPTPGRQVTISTARHELNNGPQVQVARDDHANCGSRPTI
jgi:hypothetical protein